VVPSKAWQLLLAMGFNMPDRSTCFVYFFLLFCLLSCWPALPLLVNMCMLSAQLNTTA